MKQGGHHCEEKRSPLCCFLAALLQQDLTQFELQVLLICCRFCLGCVLWAKLNHPGGVYVFVLGLMWRCMGLMGDAAAL